MEINGRFNVVLRLRPTLVSEIEGQHLYDEDKEECVSLNIANKEVILIRENYENKNFIYDYVIGPNMDQMMTYKYTAESIVNEVLKGYNSTIMAYGQTGSGKTYTTFGPKNVFENNNGRILNNQCGIVFRSLNQIFQYIEEKQDRIQFQVSCSMIQIYMENINDLLDDSKSKEILQIREDPNIGVFVNSTQISVSSLLEVVNLIRKGIRNRITQATLMNKTSSRSHVLLQILIEQRWIENISEEEIIINSRENRNISISPIRTNPKKKKHIKKGLLTIVDLAGSERLSKSNSEGLRIEEAKTINKSISALGNCIAALAVDKKNMFGVQAHIPYRNSKLTRLLTDSLGGNSKTTICACIAPTLANYDETYSTLLFASRAMNIKTQPKLNEDIMYKANDISPDYVKDKAKIETQKLREELEAVKQQLNQQYFHQQTISSVSTTTKSIGNSSLSREDSDILLARNTPKYDENFNKKTSQSKSIDRLTSSTASSKTIKNENKYNQPFLLSLSQSSLANDTDSNTFNKKEQELIKRYSGIIENLQNQLVKKTQKIMLLEEKLTKYAQLFGEI